MIKGFLDHEDDSISTRPVKGKSLRDGCAALDWPRDRCIDKLRSRKNRSIAGARASEEICYLCARTLVKHVSGLYTSRRTPKREFCKRLLTILFTVAGLFKDRHAAERLTSRTTEAHKVPGALAFGGVKHRYRNAVAWGRAESGDDWRRRC